MAGSQSSHFKALFTKNWILWKRSWCCSCFEIILPILFSFFLIAVRALVDTTLHDEKSYLSEQHVLNPGFASLSEERINQLKIIAEKQHLDEEAFAELLNSDLPI